MKKKYPDLSRLVRAYTRGKRVYGVTEDGGLYLLNYREIYGRSK